MIGHYDSEVTIPPERLLPPNGYVKPRHDITRHHLEVCSRDDGRLFPVLLQPFDIVGLPELFLVQHAVIEILIVQGIELILGVFTRICPAAKATNLTTGRGQTGCSIVMLNATRTFFILFSGADGLNCAVFAPRKDDTDG